MIIFGVFVVLFYMLFEYAGFYEYFKYGLKGTLAIKYVYPLPPQCALKQTPKIPDIEMRL